MYTRNQKHVPQKEIAPPLSRQVDFPKRVEKGAVEAGFSLGHCEPTDGRYNTLSRQTYTHGTCETKPEDRKTILERKDAIQNDHRGRHFFLGSPVSYTSENRAALLPPPQSAFQTGDPPSVQNKRNALAMNTAHFFMNDETEHSTSTTRNDYKNCDVSTMKSLRAEAALCRAEQQKTNYQLGNQEYVWSSEARSNYGTGFGAGGVMKTGGAGREFPPVRGSTPVFEAPKRASNQNLISQFTLGSSDLSEKDGIKSLKQVDFVPYPVSTSLERPHQVDAQKDKFVFGHRGVPINSLYRESFPPTIFSTNPSPTPSRRL